MSADMPETPSRWLIWAAVGAVVLIVLFFPFWVALETYVLSQNVHLLTAQQELRAGMTQAEVEKLLGATPDEASFRDSDGAMHVRYTEVYRGLLVTSSHHLGVTYDGTGKLKSWGEE
jgi:hypothetical protein